MNGKLTADEIARQIVEEVETEMSLAEASAEIQKANVASKRATSAHPMPKVDCDLDLDGDENPGSDSKSKQHSSTKKYMAGSTITEADLVEIYDELVEEGYDSDELLESLKTVGSFMGGAALGGAAAGVVGHGTGAVDKAIKAKLAKRKAAKAAKAATKEDYEDNNEYLGNLDTSGIGAVDDEDMGYDEMMAKVKKSLESKDMSAAIKEHISKLFSSEDSTLTEEFSDKAQTILEAAINERVSTVADILVEHNVQLMEQKMQRLEEAAEQFQEEIVNSLDSYVTHVAEEWMKENELQVEHGLREEISSEFMNGLKNLFAEHYIDVPEERYDVLAEMNEEVLNLRSRLNESLEKQSVLKESLRHESKVRIINEACSDLTSSEREKMVRLAEGVSFGGDEEFEDKVHMLKESYFSNIPNSNSESAIELNEHRTQMNASSPASHQKTSMETLAESLTRFAPVRDRIN